MKTEKEKKWRRLYHYLCAGCGKLRYTRHWDRKQNELCTICQKNRPPEGQKPLF